MKEIIIYLVPALIFTIGCITIYQINFFYLKRVLDWGNDKKPIEDIVFKFNINESLWMMSFLTAVITGGIFFYDGITDASKHKRAIEKEALIQYREEMEKGVKKEIMQELYNELESR